MLVDVKKESGMKGNITLLRGGNGFDEKAFRERINQSTGADIRAQVAALAALDDIDYLACRKASARELGIPSSELDKLVREARADGGEVKGQGRPLEIAEPEPWPAPVDGEALADEMRDAVSRYVLLPDGGAEIVTLWVLHTHVFGAWRVSPRLFITSPEKGCGKSTLLNSVLANLVCKPFPVANITPAIVFRVIEMAAPCLLIDEADTFMRGNEELRGILNSSHRRDDANVLRLVGDDHEPRAFSTWAPMAIAAIGRIPDTLEDRSIKITMQRRLASEPLEDIDDHAERTLQILARKAARWSEGMEGALSDYRPEVPAGVINRLASNWAPLLSIADAIGGEWPTSARTALLGSMLEREENSVRAQVLVDILGIFETQSTDRLASSFLTEKLGEMEDRPWSEWKHGKPISKAGLARLLKPYQICPRTVRFDSGSTAKGYHLSQFADANARYANNEDSADTPFQTVTPSQMSNINNLEQFQNVTSRNDVTISNPDNPLKNNDCDGVTLCEGGSGASVPETDAEQADLDERAAILEYEAGLPREEAEKRARAELGARDGQGPHSSGRMSALPPKADML